ncbi:protocadherin Fat 4-like [Babylonia areolata]|uniref:protocadherin Fat 4-like n=1 Tax=Babylonia areolata TaxID=304850 RepID=UPI003FD3AAA0
MPLVSLLLVLAGCAFGLVSSALQFTDLEYVVEIAETNPTTSTLILTDANCADDGGAAVEVKVSLTRMDPSSPCTGCFQVYRIPTTDQYRLDFHPLEELDYSQTPVYYAYLQCEDISDTSNTVSAVVEIRLRPNTPPYFGTQSSVSVTVPLTKNIEAGGSVYGVNCLDNDNDPLEYTLKTDPTSSLFYIDTSGVIRASTSLKAACFSSIIFEVTCADQKHPALSPIYIQATLSGANVQPLITELNYNRDIPEDTPVGSLASFTVTDDDTDTQCLLSTSPLDALQFFELDTANQQQINVKSTLDYEQSDTRNTNITVTCTDGYCTSSPAYLYVRVTDVNEEIELLPSDFTLSTEEGWISVDPNWTPIDPDTNDSPTYTFVSTSSYFTINPTTGVISSTVEYDVDQGAMPSTQTLVVKATDVAGHTSTATVHLTITDINDNAPTFTVGTQTITITACPSNVGTSIGSNVVATDLDSSLDGNNVVTYSGASGPFTVTASGNIVVTSQLTADTTHTLQIVASDSGTGSKGKLTSNPNAIVTVIVTECPTTTPTPPTTAAPVTTAAPTTAAPTQAPETTLADNSREAMTENLGWIIFAGLLATVFLAALAFMLWRFCYPAGVGGQFSTFCARACGDCCTPRPAPRTVQPYQHQPPAGNADFWKKHFLENDLGSQPEGVGRPSPARMDAGGGPLNVDPTVSWRNRPPLDHYY